MATQMRRLGVLLRLSVSFLTSLPLDPGEYRPGDLAKAAVFFPLVGLGIGWVLFLVYSVVSVEAQDPLLATFATLLLWVLLTRGLHIDGVADVCDALWVQREKRQAVLKDPRIGTFGVLGILFVLGAKGMLLVRLSGGALPLVLAPLFGRTVALLFGAFFQVPPRETPGLAEEFVGRVSWSTFLLWAAAVAVLSFFIAEWRAVLKTLVSFGIMFTLGRGMARAFGGVTGDVVGAGVEWGEVVWLFLWEM